MHAPAIGHRERKKLKTREAIVDAALSLFTERGFERTTVADIAAAADIAPRTFFGYFPSKEDVLFDDFDETLASLKARLGAREPGETAMDALRAWIGAHMAEPRLGEERERCRQELIRDIEPLRAHQRRLMSHFEAALTAAVADDLGVPADDVSARMVGAAAVAALLTLGEHYKGDDAAVSEDPAGILDDALGFLRGGLAALQRDRAG
jgi:AcrR family transcriptional regulator